jgi:hypothetical protein
VEGAATPSYVSHTEVAYSGVASRIVYIFLILCRFLKLSEAVFPLSSVYYVRVTTYVIIMLRASKLKFIPYTAR